MPDIFAVRLNEPLPAVLAAALIAALPEQVRLQIGRCRQEADRGRKLMAETLIRQLVRERLGWPASRIAFERSAFGKPFLKDEPAFQFNLSHSGEWVVCVLHDRPVGIDVERVRPIDLNVARRYFTEGEQGALFGLPEPQRLRRFYALWTCKESYVKAEGLGLSLPLRDFDVSIEGVDAWARPVPGSAASAIRRLRLYGLGDSLMAACAEETASFPESPRLLAGAGLAASFLHGST